MSSSLLVEELGGRRRTLTLVGSGLPLRGAAWPETTVAPTTFYPGNPEATQQVLQNRYEPSQWEFEFRTNRLIRSPARLNEGGSEQIIERAKTLIDALRSFKRGGSTLRVSWVSTSEGGSTAGRISRIGIMTKFEPAYERLDDAKVTVEFTWRGDGSTIKRAGSLRDDGTLSARVDATKSSDAVARAILDARMRQRISTIPRSADRFTLGQVEQLAKAPLKLANDFARVAQNVSSRVRQLGEIIQTVRSTPAALAGTALDIAQNAIDVSNQFVDQMSRQPPEVWSTRTKVTTLLRTARYYNGALTQSRLMADTYARLAEQARTRRSALVPGAGSSSMRTGDAYQLHIPKSGETFAQLAARYYQNPDLSDEIARANGLPGYTIEVPRIPIVIPTRRALEDANRNRV